MLTCPPPPFERSRITDSLSRIFQSCACAAQGGRIRPASSTAGRQLIHYCRPHASRPAGPPDFSLPSFSRALARFPRSPAAAHASCPMRYPSFERSAALAIFRPAKCVQTRGSAPQLRRCRSAERPGLFACGGGRPRGDQQLRVVTDVREDVGPQREGFLAAAAVAVRERQRCPGKAQAEQTRQVPFISFSSGSNGLHWIITFALDRNL